MNFCMLCLTCSISSLVVSNGFEHTRTRINSRFPSLSAKKKQQKESKGFGTPTRIKNSEAGNNTNSDVNNSNPGVIFKDIGVDSSNSSGTVEDVFRKYGLTENSKNFSQKNVKVSGERPFGEAALAKIPTSILEKIDSFLLSATFLSLSLVILCGVEISLEALRIVFPDVIFLSGADEIATKFLSPTFTPALLIFFFFSVTFGLLKYAQISSNQTVYKE